MTYLSESPPLHFLINFFFLFKQNIQIKGLLNWDLIIMQHFRYTKSHVQKSKIQVFWSILFLIHKGIQNAWKSEIPKILQIFTKSSFDCLFFSCNCYCFTICLFCTNWSFGAALFCPYFNTSKDPYIFRRYSCC